VSSAQIGSQTEPNPLIGPDLQQVEIPKQRSSLTAGALLLFQELQNQEKKRLQQEFCLHFRFMFQPPLPHTCGDDL
ncbi:hypothetical protein XENORESO_015983, partial [Xenotaenia resolanae]